MLYVDVTIILYAQVNVNLTWFQINFNRFQQIVHLKFHVQAVQVRVWPSYLTFEMGPASPETCHTS